MLEQSSGEATTRKRPGARDERAQGLVEYALIIALVGLASVIALGFLSGKINTIFSKAGNVLNNVGVAAPGGSSGGPSPTVPINTGAPALTCTFNDGVCDDQDPGTDDTLNTTNGSWTDGGAPPITGYTYQWYQQDDGSGDSCAAVVTTPVAAGYAATGSNSNSMDPPDLTEDKCYVVTVVATNSVGNSTPANSNPVHVNDN